MGGWGWGAGWVGVWGTCEVLRDSLVPAQIGFTCPSCPSSPQFLRSPKVPVMTFIYSLSLEAPPGVHGWLHL